MSHVIPVEPTAQAEGAQREFTTVTVRVLHQSLLHTKSQSNHLYAIDGPVSPFSFHTGFSRKFTGYFCK